METLIQVVQGVLAGLGILAAGAGLVYLASVNGLGVRVVVNGQVIEVTAPVPAQANASPQAGTPKETIPEPTGEAPALDQTSSATPAPTAAARDSYYERITADISLLVVSLKRLGLLLSTPKPDDPSWRSEVELVINATEMGANRLRIEEAPPEAEGIHQQLLETTERCTNPLDLLSGDLGRTNAETFGVVEPALNACTDELIAILKTLQ
ncbi:MAG: hypothetical protein D6790_02820 [Caldilineae bacterium]|nr:MAG: hypothetical protein D6790_02820 [Caldilineae bacterium]